MNVSGVYWIKLPGASISNCISIEHDALSHSFAERKWLVVLLDSTIFTSVVHSFVLGLGVLGEEAFENLVSSLSVDVLAAN